MPPRSHSLLVVLAGACLCGPGAAGAAGRACDQSDSTLTASPRGELVASVQHQVCETAAGGVAAAITVFVGDAKTPLQGTRVVAIAVPRSREEWPRVVWRDASSLEVWIPNFAKVLETRPGPGPISVSLHYCGDDPDARARVAQYQLDLQQWMAAVTAWSDARKRDPQSAGDRPQRPVEPRTSARPCRDSDLQAGS